jgi:hypothetical protein
MGEYDVNIQFLNGVMLFYSGFCLYIFVGDTNILGESTAFVLRVIAILKI